MTDFANSEMDDLEKVKRKYSYLAKLQQIKIDRIKLTINLQKLDEEEEKLKKHLEEIEES